MKKLMLTALACLLVFTGSAKKRNDGRIIPDICYRTETDAYIQKECVLDLYLPEGVEDFPTLVWFHGGGLTGGEKFIPEQLKNSGMAIVAVSYRLLPHCEFSDCIDDAAAAVAWTFRHIGEYGGDVDRIYVSGHSAGGYLTNMIGFDKKWLAAYDIDADAIAGLLPVSGHTICHFAYRDLKGIKDTQVTVDETAPLYHVRPDAPPVVFLSGDREMEMLGRYEEQAYFWRMLKVAGHKHAHIYEIDGHDHCEVVGPAYLIIRKYIDGRLKF